MKIGIIVHSHSGNTLSVAKKLKEKLESYGNIVSIEQVKPASDNPSEKNIQLKEIPNAERYDELIFGAPVWGFNLSAVMKAYLSQLPQLNGKKVKIFVTHRLPYAWMGGNKSVKEFKKACQLKSMNVTHTGIVSWSYTKRESNINDLIRKFTSL